MMESNAGPPATSCGWRACPVESAIGIALVVISALEIFFIVRVVSGNLNLRG
jgi:uncharacterized membrane protein